MKANAERLLIEKVRLQEERARARELLVARDKEDIPAKLVLTKRMLLAAARLK